MKAAKIKPPQTKEIYIEDKRPGIKGFVVNTGRMLIDFCAGLCVLLIIIIGICTGPFLLIVIPVGLLILTIFYYFLYLIIDIRDSLNELNQNVKNFGVNLLLKENQKIRSESETLS